MQIYSWPFFGQSKLAGTGFWAGVQKNERCLHYAMDISSENKYLQLSTAETVWQNILLRFVKEISWILTEKSWLDFSIEIYFQQK